MSVVGSEIHESVALFASVFSMLGAKYSVVSFGDVARVLKTPSDSCDSTMLKRCFNALQFTEKSQRLMEALARAVDWFEPVPKLPGKR
jgi:hypothetical protein